MYNIKEYKVGSETCFGEVTMVADWGFIAVNMQSEKATVIANDDWIDWYLGGRS